MKIALILPRRVDLGWIWRAKALVKALPGSAAQAQITDLQIAIGVHTGDQAPAVISALDVTGERSVVIRQYRWESIPSDRAARMFSHIDFNFAGIGAVNVPRDWGWNFADCDAWIICPDLHLGAVVPIRPILLYARDLIDRYDPHLAAMRGEAASADVQLQSILGWRQARRVFATDRHTLDDYVSFAGIWRHRCLLVPPLWPEAPSSEIKALYDRPESGALLCPVPHPHARVPEPFMRAFRDLIQAKPEARVIFAVDGFREGDGSALRAALKEQIESLNLLPEDRYQVEIIKAEEDLQRLILLCRIVISTEDFPGEPDMLLLSARFGRSYVGRATPPATTLAAGPADGRSFLYTLQTAAALFRMMVEAYEMPLGMSSEIATCNPQSSLELLFERLADGNYVA